MSFVIMKVNDKELNAALERVTANGLVLGVQFYHTQLKLAVNVPNSGVRVKVKRKTPGGNTTSRTIYPNPSKAGEPPRKRTGFGQSQIKKEVDRKSLTARVGITKAGIYMAYLDLGTKRIARRPFFMPTLVRYKSVIAKLFVSGGGKL